MSEASGILAAAGFVEGRALGSSAWLKPAAEDGFTWYVRGEPSLAYAVVNGSEVAVSVPLEIEADMPCEVGVIGSVGGRSYAVVETLHEACEVAAIGLLPMPDDGKVIEHSPPSASPSPFR